MIANEEIVIREISRLKLEPNEILVLRLPEGSNDSDEALEYVKTEFKDTLTKYGIPNECMVLGAGATFEVIAPSGDAYLKIPKAVIENAQLGVPENTASIE